MLIPKIAFDVATPFDLGGPGSEARSLFLFGDAYLDLSPEAAVSAPTPATIEKLLATPAGKWCRAGPFPSSPEGLAAASEWLHAGLSMAALDVADEDRLHCCKLPSRDTVLALAERFKALWKDEQPRQRLCARLCLSAAQPLASQAEELAVLLAHLRPHFAAVQLVVPAHHVQVS